MSQIGELSFFLLWDAARVVWEGRDFRFLLTRSRLAAPADAAFYVRVSGIASKLAQLREEYIGGEGERGRSLTGSRRVCFIFLTVAQGKKNNGVELTSILEQGKKGRERERRR